MLLKQIHFGGVYLLLLLHIFWMDTTLLDVYVVFSCVCSMRSIQTIADTYLLFDPQGRGHQLWLDVVVWRGRWLLASFFTRTGDDGSSPPPLPAPGTVVTGPSDRVSAPSCSGCCWNRWFSSLLEERTISSLPEELAVMDAEGPGEHGRHRKVPPDDELPPPVGADHYDFSITVVGGGARRGRGRARRGGGDRREGDVDVHRRSTAYIAATRPGERAVNPLQCGATDGVGSLESCVRIEAMDVERSRLLAPPSLWSHQATSISAVVCSGPA